MKLDLKKINLIGGGALSPDITFEKQLPSNLKLEFIKRVISKWDSYCVNLGLSNLLRASSFQGGFALPMTQEWLVRFVDNPHIYNHEFRELLFLESGSNLTGLYFRDSIKYWSSDEISLLKCVIYSVINELLSSGLQTSMNIPHAEFFYFSSGISVSLLYEFAANVIARSKQTNFLQNLNIDPSVESGFFLPLNQAWSNFLLPLYPVFSYHDRRQLRFIHDGKYITGLRFKDSVPSWSVEEVRELLEICEQIISRMNVGYVPITKYGNSMTLADLKNPLLNVLQQNSGLNLNNIIDPLTNKPYSQVILGLNRLDVYNHHKIKFKKSISLSKKDELMLQVVKKAKKTDILKYLDISYSENGGFRLPMDIQWNNYVNKSYITERELEFIIKEKKIKGLRFKNDLPLWSVDEVDELMDIIKKVTTKKLKK